MHATTAQAMIKTFSCFLYICFRSFIPSLYPLYFALNRELLTELLRIDVENVREIWQIGDSDFCHILAIDFSEKKGEKYKKTT